MPITLTIFENNECIDSIDFDYESDYFRYLALTNKIDFSRKIVLHTLIQTGYDYDGSPTYMEVK